MIVYMIENVISGEWFCGSKKRGYSRPKWTTKFSHASIWNSKSGPIQCMRANKLDSSVARIVSYELKELE